MGFFKGRGLWCCASSVVLMPDAPPSHDCSQMFGWFLHSPEEGLAYELYTGEEKEAKAVEQQAAAAAGLGAPSEAGGAPAPGRKGGQQRQEGVVQKKKKKGKRRAQGAGGSGNSDRGKWKKVQ